MYHVAGFWNAGENELTRRMGEGQSRGERCAICESRREPATVEIFQFSDEVDTYIFKIDTAKQIVADGRAAQPVSQEMLRAFAGMNEFDLNHMLHVDLSRPGIFIRRFGAPILLDGTHRAIRCFAKQKQFYAFELSYEESVECLLQQRISAKDAAAIVRKLRQVLDVFPSSGPVDTPIEYAPEVLREVEKMLTAEERRHFILRAVPEPE
ncbi:MAG TPA: hypothetical protein VF938_03835 [Candidatus Angelobacter sp.]